MVLDFGLQCISRCFDLDGFLILPRARQAFIYFIFLNVYLFLAERETDRQHMSGGGAEREGHTESKAGSRH